MPNNLNRRLPRVDTTRFSMVPRPDVPRSTFVTSHTVKTTFDTGFLVPIHVDEVLPGDVHRGEMTVFARLATPLFPIMDEMTLETFFFFVPARLVWDNWRRMMGERLSPSDSISYTVPQHLSPLGGFGVTSLFDYFGLPTVGQVDPTRKVSVNALPLRAYNLIYNEWFRDENLQGPLAVWKTDGPDPDGSYFLVRRNKKHDYFTSALPWPLKGGQEVSLPLSGTAPVNGIAFASGSTPQPSGALVGPYFQTDGTSAGSWTNYYPSTATGEKIVFRAEHGGNDALPMIYADLSTATGATINALRLAVQTQKLLERDARSGTRYTELLRAHFGVTPEDYRLQRPEYIGGGRTRLQTSAIPQTSSTDATSPLGSLGAAGTIADQHEFSYSATEHGYIIGLAHVGAELTYQQGLHRMWTRLTRYDFYWPAFAHLGEQAVRNDEIYCTGNPDTDLQVFGYQERWAEYRHRPSRITGLFRSTSAGTIDPWHLSQRFTALPTLNATFIEDNPPTSRVLAAGSQANGMQILFDSVFRIRTTRPLPMFSVPGMMDRF